MLSGNMSMTFVQNNIPYIAMKHDWLSMSKSLDEAETLGEVLRIQTEKYAGTEKRIIQEDVAKAMKIDQGTLSRVKNDKNFSAPKRWTSDQIKALMDGFHITDKREIQLVAYRFDLRLPKDLFRDPAYQSFLSNPFQQSVLDTTTEQRLKDLRESAGLTPEEAAVKSEGAVSASLIRELENDDAPGFAWTRATDSVIDGLAKAYNLSYQALLEKVNGSPDAPKGFPGASQATTDGPKAWHYGIVSAGIDGRNKPSKPKLVNIPNWLSERYDSKDILVLTVKGDSMTCEDVRKSIPEGTEVYFHKTLQPENGEIVAVWLEDRDIGVIKIWRPERDTTVLQSYNYKHQPILIDESNPGQLQGVYVGKSESSPMRFDR